MKRINPERGGFSTSQIRLLKSLKSPVGIQKFLDTCTYHKADTAWSPKKVIEARTAHCLEGAIFAAAALKMNGYPPLILDLEAVNDSDHVIAVYRQAGGWGALGTSSFAGLRYRSPVYKSLRELALSYFENFYNLRGERTLRNFSQPVNLSRFDHLNWMSTEEPVWFIAEHLVDIPHKPLLTASMVRSLVRLDRRSYKAGLVGHPKKNS